MLVGDGSFSAEFRVGVRASTKVSCYKSSESLACDRCSTFVTIAHEFTLFLLLQREIPLGLKSGGLVTVAELKAGKKVKKKKKAKLNAHSLSFDMDDEEESASELPSPSPTKKQKT